MTKTEQIINYAFTVGIFIGSPDDWKKRMSQQDKNVCARFYNDKAYNKLEAKLWTIRNKYENYQVRTETQEVF